MSTRSIIAATLPDGLIGAVYCHSDGYPSWNGRYLMNYWHSAGRAALLTSLGDMSSLGKVMGKKHDFNWRSKKSDEVRHIQEQRGLSWRDADFADRIAEIEAEVDAASYPQAVEEWNLYYGRDRGDDAFAQGCYVNTIPELIEWWQHAYLYLWRHETWWMYVGPNDGTVSNPEDRDPERINAEWVTLAGVLRRNPDMAEHPPIKPYPNPCLPKRSLRLWEAEVPNTEPAPSRSTGRRATMI